MLYNLEDKCKELEKFETGRRFLPNLPVLARIDGRSFHTWTKGLNRPFDDGLVKLMQETTKELVAESNALIGYTQSDEITLLFYSSERNSQIFFDGKIFKMVSSLASIATAFFNHNVTYYLPSKVSNLAYFDCRCWQVPTKEDVVDVLTWRELDASRNSVEALARKYYSHKECFGKNCSELQEMIFQKGFNWNDLDSCLKRGTYIRREKIIRKFTTEEIYKLPMEHEARKNKDLQIIRHEYKKLDMPPINKISNPFGVLFHGQEPEKING